jgi:folate-binding Fe-S cluster repair protein YgfZ
VEVAARERAYVRVAGADACEHLQNMVSNDVEALQVGDACPALLLTAKARVIAPVVVWRRGEQDFLVLTEPELGDPVRALLVRMRLRLRCEIEAEEHTSALVFGGEGIASELPGAAEVLDADLEPTLDVDELERRRIRAGAASSTTVSSPPKRASTRRTSASRRAAIPGRSRSRASTTAVIRIEACVCSSSRTCRSTMRSSCTTARWSAG